MKKNTLLRIFEEKLKAIQNWQIPENLNNNLVNISSFHFLVKDYFNLVSQLRLVSDVEELMEREINTNPSYQWIKSFLDETETKDIDSKVFEKFSFGTFINIKKDKIYFPPIRKIENLIIEAKNNAAILHTQIIHVFGRAGFIKNSSSSPDDIQVGDNYLITTQGKIYKDEKEVGYVKRAGYYLLRRLKAGGKSYRLGKKDFKPSNKKETYTWGTIKRAKMKINQICGEIIGVDNEKYFYAYR